jgi:hypothetical protein
LHSKNYTFLDVKELLEKAKELGVDMPTQFSLRYKAIMFGKKLGYNRMDLPVEEYKKLPAFLCKAYPEMATCVQDHFYMTCFFGKQLAGFCQAMTSLSKSDELLTTDKASKFAETYYGKNPVKVSIKGLLVTKDKKLATFLLDIDTPGFREILPEGKEPHFTCWATGPYKPANSNDWLKQRRADAEAAGEEIEKLSKLTI